MSAHFVSYSVARGSYILMTVMCMQLLHYLHLHLSCIRLVISVVVTIGVTRPQFFLHLTSVVTQVLDLNMVTSDVGFSWTG